MKTVIEMAREAGLPEAWISDTGVLKWSDLERFAELVRADEREACAKVCEERIGGAVQPNEWWSGFKSAMKQCAAAIRARSNT